MARTVIITGGSGAIGSLLVERFLELGDQVFVTTALATSLQILEESAACGPGRLGGIVCDLSDQDAIDQLVEATPVGETGGFVLVNNARSRATLRSGPDGFIQRSDFMAEYLLDVVVPYELSMAMARRLDDRLEAVINIGSQYGSVASNPSLYEEGQQSGFVHYNVAKAALHHLTRELAVRLAPIGTRVNAVAFGGLEDRVSDAFSRRYAAMVPNGRMLRAADVPGPVVFLASRDASAVNGHVLAADGGWSVW